eukprot:Awhi_evm1s3626
MLEMASYWNSVNSGERRECLSDLENSLTGQLSCLSGFHTGNLRRTAFQISLQEDRPIQADLSLQEDRPIQADRIHALYAQVIMPLCHVNLKAITHVPGADPLPYRDGSERYPFFTLDEGKGSMSLMEDPKYVAVECGYNCNRKKCGFPSCGFKICKQHGQGRGVYICKDDEIMFDVVACRGCDYAICQYHWKEQSSMECKKC